MGFNYGIAFLSAVLKQRGHETALINLNEKLGFPLDPGRIRNEIEAFQPDLIGFSIVTNQYNVARDVARTIREHVSVPLVAGGVHVTMDPQAVLADGLFDYACVGEGESALADLADALEKGEPTDAIPNIWKRSDGEVVANAVRPFEDLADLPIKDYELFDFQKLIDAKDGWVGLMTSRGCIFRCSYCFNHRMVETYSRETGLSTSELRYTRHHPVDHVISEIEHLLKNYSGIDVFIFDDDLFTFDREYVEEFCRRYRETTDVRFVVNGHVKVFDAEIAQLLKDAGCWMVKFGVESGSDRVRRDVMNRHMTNEEIAGAFEVARDAGLETSAFVMFGLPHETREDILDTIKLLARIVPDRIRWAIFFPYPHTKAFEIARDAGMIDFDKMERLSNFMDASCLDFGDEHNLFIEKLQKTFPWCVNAHMDSEAAEFYAGQVELVEGLSPGEFVHLEPHFRNADSMFSQQMSGLGRPHYTIKYNDFMAVLCQKTCNH